ncbi:PQ loop repeat-domain-containing protein [Xylogone sp. PMI_703]|nr:PQ loop repeat-domain-containing protein [Xylogone sp. PMI_703]
MSDFFLRFLSQVFGWVYTLCWSLSFYPQPILNFRRKSTVGTTIDFPAINLPGFAAYFISNAAFLYSPVIRHQYALRNNGLTPTVEFNDLAFAGHAVILSLITLTQFYSPLWGFEERNKHGAGAKISTTVLGILAGCVLGVLITIFLVVSRNDPDPTTGWAWIDVIYAVSYVKLFITLVKYIPQVATNYRNRSTQGWAIEQILLDFIGGILSIAQLGIDSYLQHDWSGITGNPVKLALGNSSIVFDLIFILQHYIIYRNEGKEAREGEEESLLGNSRSD